MKKIIDAETYSQIALIENDSFIVGVNNVNSCNCSNIVVWDIKQGTKVFEKQLPIVNCKIISNKNSYGAFLLGQEGGLYFLSYIDSAFSIGKVPGLEDKNFFQWSNADNPKIAYDNNVLILLSNSYTLNKKSYYSDSLEIFRFNVISPRSTSMYRVKAISNERFERVTSYNPIDLYSHLEGITYDNKHNLLYLLLESTEHSSEDKVIVTLSVGPKSNLFRSSKQRINSNEGVRIFRLNDSRKDILIAKGRGCEIYNICTDKLSNTTGHVVHTGQLEYYDRSQTAIFNRSNEIKVHELSGNKYSLVMQGDDPFQIFTSFSISSNKVLYASGYTNKVNNKTEATRGIWSYDLVNTKMENASSINDQCLTVLLESSEPQKVTLPEPVEEKMSSSQKINSNNHSNPSGLIKVVGKKTLDAYTYYTKTKTDDWKKYSTLFTPIRFNFKDDNSLNIASFDFLTDVLGPKGQLMNFAGMDNADFTGSATSKPVTKLDGMEYRNYYGKVTFHTRSGPKTYTTNYAVIYKDGNKYGFQFFYSSNPVMYLIRF